MSSEDSGYYCSNDEYNYSEHKQLADEDSDFERDVGLYFNIYKSFKK